jgi:hypothetical protein
MKKLKGESYAHSHSKNIYTTWLRAAISAIHTDFALPDMARDYEKQPPDLSEIDFIPHIKNKSVFKPVVFYENLFIKDDLSIYFYDLYKKEIERLCKVFFKKQRKGEWFNDLGFRRHINIIEILPKGKMIPNSCFSVFQEFPVYEVPDDGVYTSIIQSPIAPPYGYIYWLRQIVNSKHREVANKVFDLHYPLTDWEKNKILLGIDGCSPEQIMMLWNIVCPQQMFVYNGKERPKPRLKYIFDIGIQRHNPNWGTSKSCSENILDIDESEENSLYAAIEIINKSDVTEDKYNFCNKGDIGLACVKTDQILKQFHPKIIEVKNDPEFNSFEEYKSDGKLYCDDCGHNSVIFWKKKNWYLCENCKATGISRSVKHYYKIHKYEEFPTKRFTEDGFRCEEDEKICYANKEYTPQKYL